VELTKLALPLLRKTKGRIIYVSTGAAGKGYPSWSIYGASKAAMNGLCASVGAEEKDVIAVAVRPGMVDTDMQLAVRESKTPQDFKDRFITAHKEGKLVKPEDVGKVLGRMVLDIDKEFSGKFVRYVINC